ncbi:MAG: hypothetical protein JO244_11845 [Solirubrobacterales bacterium]|nr:hypothetical protein [Solirubrobacterales bacterium]
MASRRLEHARWWTLRRAQNRKPATYRCPLCGRYLPSLSEHTLIMPEGDPQRRRHAHTQCVLAARKAGRLPTREEWLATQPRQPGLVRRLIGRWRRPSTG